MAQYSARGKCQVAIERYTPIGSKPLIAHRPFSSKSKCGDRESKIRSRSRGRRCQNVEEQLRTNLHAYKRSKVRKIRHHCTTIHHHSTPRHRLPRRIPFPSSARCQPRNLILYAQVGIVMFLRFRSLSNIPQYGSTPPNSCFQGSSNASKLT